MGGKRLVWGWIDSIIMVSIPVNQSIASVQFTLKSSKLLWGIYDKTGFKLYVEIHEI